MTKTIQAALLFMIVNLLLVAAPSAGYACTCAPKPTTQEEFKNARAVFSGKLISISGQGEKSEAVFQVTSSWKGVTTPRMKIKTPSQVTACGFPFEIGKSYLIYTDHSLETSICMRTKELSEAQEDLSILGSGRPIE